MFRKPLILAVLLFLIGVLITWPQNESSVTTYKNSIYIWQRSWNENVREAIKDASGDIAHFIVLCGVIEYRRGQIMATPVNVQWHDFEDLPARITLAFRIHASAAPLLEERAQGPIIQSMKAMTERALVKAEKYRLKIDGIQLDYDCPTSKLDRYANFLKAWRPIYPRFDLSITALPTWLNSLNFSKLIAATSYYVLQLHSFEKPKDISQAKEIFPKGKASAFVLKAARFRHPFYVSLPTYGYEVMYLPSGKFLGLRAENESRSWKSSVLKESVMSDPAAILSFMNHNVKIKPRNLLGYCWYRMPLKSDEFNWDMKTLKAVITGRKPSVRLKTDFLSSGEGLSEIYVSNSGEMNIGRDVEFNVLWPRGLPIIYDILGKYKSRVLEMEHGLSIQGPAPKVGQKVMVGWLRTTSSHTDYIPLNITEVKYHEY